MRALLLAAHPVPTAAVTLLGVGLALAWGRDPAGALLVAATVLSGQLSIGWCDDAADAAKDSGRTDKPIPSGAVSARTVRVAAGFALLVTVLLSAANGVVPGFLHLAVVAGGWTYALWLERTVASPVPYLVSFAALPAYVHLGTVGAPAPWWVVAAGALLGLGAHFANVLPDIDRDRAVGTWGLPQRLGVTWTRRLAPVPPAVGTAVLLVGPALERSGGLPSAIGPSGGLPPAVGVGAAAVALAAVATPRRGRLTFLAVLAVAGVDVLLLAVLQ